VQPTPEFREIYERHSEAVYRTALRVTGNVSDAEDVLQNVFLRVLVRIGEQKLALDPVVSPDHYLRRAATNASIDLIRRKTVASETTLEEGRLRGGREDKFVQKARVRQALARIPAEDAELFVLCYLEGYSYDELAEQFQVERGTIGSRLHRIRAALKKELGE
jgi:RNA polymerase sigma-70 factor, ECF subfamily